MKSTGKREVEKKKAAKIYCLDVILLLMDINMKKGKEKGKRGKEKKKGKKKREKGKKRRK